jgi:hypothetical protein
MGMSRITPQWDCRHDGKMVDGMARPAMACTQAEEVTLSSPPKHHILGDRHRHRRSSDSGVFPGRHVPHPQLAKIPGHCRPPRGRSA